MIISLNLPKFLLCCNPRKDVRQWWLLNIAEGQLLACILSWFCGWETKEYHLWAKNERYEWEAVVWRRTKLKLISCLLRHVAYVSWSPVMNSDFILWIIVFACDGFKIPVRVEAEELYWYDGSGKHHKDYKVWTFELCYLSFFFLFWGLKFAIAFRSCI